MVGSTSGGHSLDTPRYWNEQDLCRLKQKKYLLATQISASPGVGLHLGPFFTAWTGAVLPPSYSRRRRSGLVCSNLTIKNPFNLIGLNNCLIFKQSDLRR